jgi:hypothetical protein
LLKLLAKKVQNREEKIEKYFFLKTAQHIEKVIKNQKIIEYGRKYVEIVASIVKNQKNRRKPVSHFVRTG